ncbi:MAG: glycosyltransferase family 9 protein [Bacteroidetes bacterium]|nr:MAG: glycosyltransferase family 9 protein [Bacteroidota bacterium]MBL1145455.1 glycosyltransferase family 9 protein [Bacteroidota bacterium]MCB0802421.1 glycosyltransferase family 9 protein [Flavobacteriales bacterium]NOG58253.1 glycosyltransferase family 9 protein [Bacteroidota bacterium]
MKRILIIQTSTISNVVLTTPLIEKIAQHFPETKIDFLVNQGNQEILMGHPKLNQLYVWKRFTNKYKNLIRLILIFRKKNYDIVINTQRNFVSGLITVLSKGKILRGFSKNPFSIFFDKKVIYRINGSHETSRNLALINDLTDKKYVAPKLYPRSSDIAAIAKFQEFPYVCIAPISNWGTKQFPQVKWIELILSFNDNWIIYLLGSKDDYEECEEIRLHTERKNINNLAGKLSILASAALMAKAKMNYVNETAPLHLASALNAPINVVYCSTVPHFGFGPLSIHSKIIESELDLPCRPCGLHGKHECPLGHFDCAHSIDINKFDKP